MKGKLIVIEGIDGSGKTTQSELLQKYFEKEQIPYKTIDFPRYDDSFYGDMIARFLRGEFGELEQVNPYLISVIYALDRKEAKTEIENWLRDGNIVIANRYATSNMAHQSGRVSIEEREKFVQWEEKLEYEMNQIPREDIVLFLDVPYKIAEKLMENEERKDRAYKKGEQKDMVEKNDAYLAKSEEAYLWLAGKFPHWKRITCIDARGEMRSREAIHEDIRKIVMGEVL